MRRTTLITTAILLALAFAAPIAAGAPSSLGEVASVLGSGAAAGGVSEASTFSLLGLGLAGLALFPRSRFE